MTDYNIIGCVADKSKQASDALAVLVKRYDLVDMHKEPKQKVDAIVVLGGDGFMLHTLHDVIDQKIPIYGMNCGSIGFLMFKSPKIGSLGGTRYLNENPEILLNILSTNMLHNIL